MREVQVTVAKTRLDAILRDVERGESIAITRKGKKVAVLVPIEHEERIQSEKAMDRFMGLRSQWQPTGMSREEVLAARHEGHRF